MPLNLLLALALVRCTSAVQGVETLRGPYCRAVAAWGFWPPTLPIVVEQHLGQATGGGMFLVRGRIIILDRDFNWASVPASDPVYLTLLHEYGHSLGLPHLARPRWGVMTQGWEGEIAMGPTRDDLEAAVALNAAISSLLGIPT